MNTIEIRDLSKSFRGMYAVDHLNMTVPVGAIYGFIGEKALSNTLLKTDTTHAKKQDYMMSKTITGAFSMACICVTYLIGTVAAGILSGTSFEVNVASLIIAILGKMIMSLL